MDDAHIFTICILVAVLGGVTLGGIVFFGTYLFRQNVQKFWKEHSFWMEMMHFWEKTGIRPNLPRYLSDSFAEFLQRRNEFWTSYGQVLIATLMIIVLTILLLTKTITAEAGLPILSGISGFAIAKGVSVGRTGGGQDGDQKG